MSGRSCAVGAILVGGSGSRLWPISSAERPKQFVRLFGTRSLYQKTIARMYATSVSILAACANARHETEMREQAQEIGHATPFLLLEPAPRDSAPALAAVAAWALAAYGPDVVIVATPGDHLIGDETAFAREVERAIGLAGDGYIVTFGIRPTFASAEYGYIERGAPIGGYSGAFAVKRFHEKPSETVAEAYCGQDEFLWNGGVFIFAAGMFAQEAARHMPDIWAAATDAVARGKREQTGLQLEQNAFTLARRISVDYALMELSRRIAVIPVGFGWTDLGSWDAVYRACDKDEAGNVVHGNAILSDSSGTLVIAETGCVVMTGLRDMAVICSREGVFVAPRTRSPTKPMAES